MVLRVSVFMLLFLLALLPGCDRSGSSGEGKIRLAVVSNSAADFWKHAQAGIDDAVEKYGVECELKVPATGTPEEQLQIIEGLISRGFDGMALSAIVPKAQTAMINQAAKVMKVVTQDSDAPGSDRICYIGTDNYDAGKQAGKALMEAIPDGGKVWLFVGKADSANASERKAGLEDAVKGSKITIVDLRTDDTDRSRAKSNAEDVIVANDDVAALVGLWAYNPPAILEAVRDSGKLGKIKIIGFDEEEQTLRGIQQGHIHATVVQSPYRFGYESVRVLKSLVEGDTSVVPEDQTMDIPTQIIRKDNVDAFLVEVKARLARVK